MWQSVQYYSHFSHPSKKENLAILSSWSFLSWKMKFSFIFSRKVERKILRVSVKISKSLEILLKSNRKLLKNIGERDSSRSWLVSSGISGNFKLKFEFKKMIHLHWKNFRPRKIPQCSISQKVIWREEERKKSILWENRNKFKKCFSQITIKKK